MRNAIYGLTATAIAAAAILSPAPAYAQFTPLSIDLNQSYYLNTGRSITRVAIANPKIADVSLLDGTSLNVIGISPGTTTLNVWASNGYRYEYRITVSNQDSGLAKIIEDAIGLPDVRVQMIGGKVLLRGTVKNQYEKKLAYKIAKLYVGKDAESSSSSTHWYNKNWLFRNFSKINAQIYALIENGKARIISRPNVTTMSGRDAKILIGGEIPYESSVGFGATTTQFREYGIGLDLHTPTVDRDGNITTELETQVSRLDWGNAVTKDGYKMPGLVTRSAYTTVNIPSGMTMVIGGLLNSDDANTIQKVPLLGNIPILGELFKYHNKTRQRTEIVVLITPRVVSEETPARMSPDMEDAYNDSRREVRDMKQVDINGDIPEKSNEQLAKEAKEAAKAAKKAARAQAKAPAVDQPAAPADELPGDRIKATARDILDRMDK